jgi:Family of unknown function (DUF6262)
MNRSSEALRNAARRRHLEAEKAVTVALREARKNNLAVTFSGLAAKAGVSTDFIYRHPQLRSQVEELRRTRGQASRNALTGNDTDAVASTLIRRLSQEIVDLRRQHREETAELQRALAAAHGELLQLRRRLTDVESS